MSPEANIKVVINMKRALVLFKGTGSVDRSLLTSGFHVDSLDISPKFGATWTCDILTWDYKQLKPGTYDFVWASPPCTEFSRARTTASRPRNLELADSIVAKTLEIIHYLKPKSWLLENPQTGMLKNRPLMQGIPYRDITYCKYSDGVTHRYRKATRLWGHLPTFVPRPMCTQKTPCPMLVDRRHPTSAQRFSTDKTQPYTHSLEDLYSMPKQLTDSIAEAAARYEIPQH